jgi:hypothetical protein
MSEDAEILFVYSADDAAPTRRGEQWHVVARHCLERSLHGAARVSTRAIDAADIAAVIAAPIVVASISNASLRSVSYRPLLESLCVAPTHLFLAARGSIDRTGAPDWLASASIFDLTSLEDASLAGSDDVPNAVDDLARAVAAARSAPRTIGSATAAAVFLAAAESVVRDDRERIRRELASHGYRVVGGGPYTDGIAAEQCRRDLADALLSIHLLASGSHRDPIVTAEFREALSHGASHPDFAQLVWLERDGSAVIGLNDLVATAFERAGTGAEIEVLRTGIEDFKTYVADRLRRGPRQHAPRTPASHDHPRLYLMFDRRDEEAADAVQSYARDAGIDVIAPSFDANQVTLREHHQQSLRDCDAAMIIYGRVTEPWVRMKQQDLMKAAGLGRTRPMIASAIFIAPEPSESKVRYSAPNVSILRSTERIEPEIIAPFLRAIQNADIG